MSDDDAGYSHSDPLCLVTWPLIEPNAEDRAAGRTHECVLLLFHREDHRCRCGDTLPWA